MQRFGISIISLFPWIIFSPWLFTHFLKKYIDFLEISPIRGITKKSIFDIKVLGFTDAWNPGSFKEVIKGTKEKNPLAPKLHDWIIFPNKKICHINSQGIIEKYSDSNSNFFITVHSIKEWEKYTQEGLKVYLEVHPGLNMTWKEIKDWAKKRGKILALDLYHIRRDLREDEMISLTITDKKSKLGNIFKVLVELLPYTNIIHLSTDRNTDELKQFLNIDTRIFNRHYTDFEKMLLTIREQKYEGDFLLEIAPAKKWELLFFPIWYKKIILFIQKVKEVMKIN